MTMRLRLTHRTEYRYESPVTYSYNEARLTPQTTATQTVLGSTVRTEPPTTALRYWDYWGTQVTAFDLHRPHSTLEVLSTSTVETGTDSGVTAVSGDVTASPAPARGPAWPHTTRDARWEVLGDQRFRDLHAEFLAQTQYTGVGRSMSAAAVDVAGQPDPASAVQRASEVVRDHLTYQTGATGVRTTAVQAWEAKTGVCQDFAHVTIALLRQAGIPARYVSGYLHPSVTPELGSTVVGESHAWVEAWVGDWLAIDPTNGGPVGDRHVLVGRARDYRDVSPVRGLYAGAGGSTLTVSVEITRLR